MPSFLQTGIESLFNLENTFLGNLQMAPSRVHNVLRNVGKFPLIITTNMDELLERFLWKTGNGGEKLRLDQVGMWERRAQTVLYFLTLDVGMQFIELGVHRFLIKRLV